MFTDDEQTASVETDNPPGSSERPAARRRARQRQAVQQELLKVARELMLEVGPDNVTLREVARRADFSPAAIYTYFANRDAIILSLMEDSFRRLDAYVRRVPQDSPPDQRMIEFCLAYMDFGRENPADLRCILSATSLDLPAGVDPSLGLEAARLIGETCREGIEQGVFRAPDGLGAAEMTYQLWALVHGMTVLEGIDLSQVQGEICANPRRIIETFVRGMRAT